MRSPPLAPLAAAFAAFAFLTGAGATAPPPAPSGMPPLKRWAPAAQHGDTETRRERKPQVETLLDEVGRLTREVSAAEVEGWKRELAGRGDGATAGRRDGERKRPSPERFARLHLWLGEYKLAQLEDPLGAYFHFRTINRLTPGPPLHPSGRRSKLRASARDGEGSLRKPPAGSFRAEELARLKGRAVLNLAIGRFFQGAYAEATQRFKKLLDRKTALPGYSAREAALWYRHASACYGYHQVRARAGITEPAEIDPLCGASALAITLRGLKRPYDKPSVLKACRGNVISVTGPGNNAAATITTVLNYTTDGPYSQPAKIGQPLTVTNNLGHAVHLRYDPRGNTVQIWDALGITKDLTYNLADQPLSALNPATGMQGPGRSSTLNSYQYVGGPLANTKLYDEAGLLIRQVDTAYGQEGETVAVTGNTEPVSFAYDAAYRLKTLYDGKGNPTNYAYHTAGYLSLVTYPGGDTLSYPSYAADGALLQRVDGRGIVTNYLHNDPDGLLSGIQYPAYPALNVAMSYDSYARLSSMTDGSGSHSYGFDDNDTLTNETTTYTGLPAKSVGYTFHPDGSRATMTTPAGTFQCGYDGAQRMTSVTNPFGETSVWTWLNNDWLKTQSLHNGAKATWTYNALGLPTDLESRQGPNPTDPLLSSFTGMTYDGAGNRLSMTASIPAHPAFSGTNNYQCDTKDQLTLETSTRAGGYTNNFVFDPAGNPTTFKGATATFNVNNQRTSDTHDANGNPTTYKGTALTFDPENRMTAYGTALTAGYRGDGLRAWKQTAAGRTYALYDGEMLLAEMNASGTVTAVNTWGTAGLVSRNSTSSTVYYTFDPHGSVAQRQDGAGTVLTSHAFDGHGAEASTGAGDPFGYCGQWGYYADTASSLQLLTNRYYDVTRGRFLNRDPIGYEGGKNLYSYVGNGVINGTDPDGLSVRWLERPSWYGYAHAWIWFSPGNTPCSNNSFGLYRKYDDPVTGKRIKDTIHSPDPYDRPPGFNREVAQKDGDPRFEQRLCECIQASISFWNVQDKSIPLYFCGSWARDMWECATTGLRPFSERRQEKYNNGVLAPR